MVTDPGELLWSSLHVLDAHGEVEERAGLLAVGGSRAGVLFGEEGEVQSPTFSLVGRRGGSFLASVSNYGVTSMAAGLTLVSRDSSRSRKALLREAVSMASSLFGVPLTCFLRCTPEAAPLRADFLFPMVVIALLFLDVAGKRSSLRSCRRWLV